MRRMPFLLTITSICVGCVSQGSTSTGVISSSTPPTPLVMTSTSIQITETALPTQSPTMLPIPGESVELPEYLEMPCWHVPGFEYEAPQGWSRYIHAEYCFTFTYPSDWVLVASRHFIALSKGTVALVIGFRKNDENILIQRAGVGAGEIETVGILPFLGQEISKDLLVDDGKTKEVLFQYGTEITADDLAFTLSGGNYDVNYELAALEDEVITIFDEIVNSFQRISPK